MSFNPFTLFGLLAKPAPTTKTVKLQRDVVDRRNNSYNRGAGFNSYESFPSIANQRRTPVGRQFSELDRMRARLRWLYCNDPYIQSVVENLTVNVIGSTLPKLFLDAPKLDDENRRLLGNQYTAWAKDAGRVDFLGRHDLYMMLSIIIRHFILEGEAFIRIRREGGLRLQVVDPGQVPIYTSEGFNRTTTSGASDGTIYQLGALVDKEGRVKSWAVNSTTDNVGYRQTYTQFLSEQSTDIVPVEDMLHLYDPAESNSYRGEPCLGTVLTTAGNLMEYNDAALQNAKFGASNVGFLKQAYMEEVGGGGATLSGKIAEAGTTSTDGDSVLDAVANGSVVTDSGIGISKVPEGYTFEPYNTTYPDGQFSAFVQAHQRNIAAAGGVAFHSASGDLRGVNYSSGRIGEQQMQRRCERIQTLLDTQVMSKIIRLLYTQLLMENRIKPRVFKAVREPETSRVVYSGSFTVDPLKKVQAETVEIMNGTRSRREIVADDGRDPDTVLAQVKAEAEDAKESSSEATPAASLQPLPTPEHDSDNLINED